MMKKYKDVDKDGLNELIHLSKNLLRVVYVIVIVYIIDSIVLLIWVLCLVVDQQ